MERPPINVDRSRNLTPRVRRRRNEKQERADARGMSLNFCVFGRDEELTSRSSDLGASGRGSDLRHFLTPRDGDQMRVRQRGRGEGVSRCSTARPFLEWIRQTNGQRKCRTAPLRCREGIRPYKPPSEKAPRAAP